jgi:hypothetical protein
MQHETVLAQLIVSAQPVDMHWPGAAEEQRPKRKKGGPTLPLMATYGQSTSGSSVPSGPGAPSHHVTEQEDASKPAGR